MHLFLAVVVSVLSFTTCSQLRYAKKDEYQYMSIMVHGEHWHVCNAVLIMSDRVLTSSNCVLFPQFRENNFVARNLKETSVDVNAHFILVHDPGSTRALISETKHHPKLSLVSKAQLMGNEASVLMLDQEIPGVRHATFPTQNVKKLEEMYKKEETWPKQCEIVSFNIGSMSDEEVKAAGINDLRDREFYKQALKVKLIKDEQCVKELCAFNDRFCSINLEKLGMFCVKAEHARFNKTTMVTYLTNETYEMEYGTCRGIFGSPLICDKHLWGVGAYFAGQYCHTSNPPMLFVKANLLREVAASSRNPIVRKSFAPTNYIPSIIVLLTVAFLIN